MSEAVVLNLSKESKFKISYLLPEMKWGGSEKHIIQLAAGLRQRGYDARITCLFREGLLACEVKERDIPFECLNLPYRWTPAAVFRISKWIQSNPTDILHTCLFGFHFFAGLPARLAKTPIILSSRREIAQWQNWNHRLWERLGNLYADKIICCSKAVEQWTLEKESAPPQKVLTIYNGVDLNRFIPNGNSAGVRQHFGIPADAPLIGTVANLSREKGYPYLLEACERIGEKNPDAWFLFVGFGPLEKELKERAGKMKGHEQIIFTGARRDVPNLIRAMDVFILASVIEGFPNVLLEALAMAKPVVATNVGGIPELIGSGRTGILVPPKDGCQLAGAVCSLLEDPAYARSLGARGAELVRKNFSLERMIDQYEAFYLSLLEPSEAKQCVALSA